LYNTSIAGDLNLPAHFFHRPSMDPHAASDFSALLASLADELQRQSFPAGALYVVATPMGNIADISVRALKVLATVDAIACEDTRNTGQLMSRYGLSKPLLAAHQHNEREVAQKIIQRLHNGERIALVSDAGTPAVSDPGARMVDEVRLAGLPVIPIAGASAAVAALSASGLMNDQFRFVGFLPAKDRQRDLALAALANDSATLVFYEAPHRIGDTLDAMLRAFGPQRRVVIARELSKLFEQMHRCALSEAALWLQADANRQRGEFVLLIEGSTSEADTSADAKHLLSILLQECPVSQAAALAAKITGMKKNALYAMALQMSGDAADA
jgi:16S rRNA (cytidine1402-2'-O)-methyltransferase